MKNRAERLAGIGAVVVTASFLGAMLSGCGVEGPKMPEVLVGEDSNAVLMLTLTHVYDGDLEGTYDAVTEATGQRLVLHGTVTGKTRDGGVVLTLQSETNNEKLTLTGTTARPKSGKMGMLKLTLEIPNVNGPVEALTLRRGSVGEYNRKANDTGAAAETGQASLTLEEGKQ